MTAVTFTTDAQKAAYVAGADAAVEEARRALAHAVAVEAPYTERCRLHTDVRAAAEHAHECRLQVYGVTCETCEGHMIVMKPGSRAPWDAIDCPACNGAGKVLPDHRYDRRTERDPDEQRDNLEESQA